MSDILLDKDIQSHMGARDFGRLDSGAGGIVQPELVPCALMKMIEADGMWHGKMGVARSGGRYVCPLPAGYDHNVGIMPHDGKLLITRPGKPTLVADPDTGTVKKAV